MITPLLEQVASQIPLHLQNIPTCPATKFSATLENARKAYLRTIYGCQPGKGRHWGYINYAQTQGSVVTIEVYFMCSRKPYGVFELPLAVFKVDGENVVTSQEVEKLVFREMHVVVSSRYKFNGISLSNVTAVEFDSKATRLVIIHKQPKSAAK